MTIRHKRIVATLDTGTAADWNNDHITDFSTSINHDCQFLGVVVTECYDTAQTSGGSAPVITLEDNHTWVKFSTGATTDNISSMRHKINNAAGNITNALDYPIFSSSVNLKAFYTANEVFQIGFMASATSPFTANQDGAYFRIKDNKLYAVVGNGTAETEEEITDITLSQDCYLNLRIILSTTQALFYVDDMSTEKITITTNIPTADLTIKFNARSKNNVNTILRVDGVSLQILRQV
jgi:hypothetical protein